MNPQKQDNS